MVRANCAVLNCDSTWRQSSVKFVLIPCSEERRNIWLEAAGRMDLIDLPLEEIKFTYFCNLHFEPCMYGKKTLKKSAIPTLRLPTPSEIFVRKRTEFLKKCLKYGPRHPDISDKKYSEMDGSQSLATENIRKRKQIQDNDLFNSRKKLRVLLTRLSEHELKTKMVIKTEEEEVNITSDKLKEENMFKIINIKSEKEDVNMSDKETKMEEISNNPERGMFEIMSVKSEAEMNLTSEVSDEEEFIISEEENIKLVGETSAEDELKLICKKTEEEEITKEQFLKGCDKFLTPELSAIVKTQVNLKQDCNSNTNIYPNIFTNKFKWFCLNMYCSSPLAYQSIMNNIGLPSKSMLAEIEIGIESTINEQTWALLGAATKSMSPAQKECVLCMGGTSLELHIEYDYEKDKILGLHEVDLQQKPVPAQFAFTLMLRGLLSNWEQPIGFSFVSSCNIDESLQEWIMNTAKRLQQLGFNIRAFVSDSGSDFLNFAAALKISTKTSYFIKGKKKIFYIFDVPHLMKSVRNNLINFNFEFNGKTASWKDIENMYKLDITQKTRLAPRLTDFDIYPERFPNQNVRYVQIFSNSVVEALKYYESLGMLKVANGTIEFFEIMSDLSELLNSTNDKQIKYKDEGYQEEILDKAKHLLSSLYIMIKHKDQDVTNILSFISPFIISIDSFRQLHKDMACGSYSKYLLARRINIDWLENFFTLALGTIARKPNFLRFMRAFTKKFFCQIINLADTTNNTDDFDVLSHYLAYSKKHRTIYEKPQSQGKQKSKDIITKTDDSIPEEKTFHFICVNLLKKCIIKHKKCNLFVKYASVFTYPDGNPHQGAKINIGCKAYNVPDNFISYIRCLELEFMSIFPQFIGQNIGHRLFEPLIKIEFSAQPCECFPKDYLVEQFIAMRMSYFIKCTNKKFKTTKTSDNTLSVANL